MKKVLFFATVLIALYSCSNNDYVGNESLLNNNENGAISFSLSVPAVTRAEKVGGAAATDLGNQFIIYGEKNETSYTAPATGNLVFPNYLVNWTTNTAYTTTSNTKDWEYVGITPSGNYQSNITMAGVTYSAVNVAQTIKYWDYSASSYTFTAVSANQADIESGYVKIQKNTASNATNGLYGKGYTITVTDDAHLSNLYLSDRNQINKSADTDRAASNKYGGNVTMKFRNVQSHVRVGMYETISGYDITNIKFYVFNATSGDLTEEAKNATPVSCFGAKCPNIKVNGYAGTLTVTYENASSAIKNQPIVTPSGDSNTNLLLGTNINAISTTSPMKETSATPTWDTEGGAFTPVMPQAKNTTNLKLKVDYTLYNQYTKETIEVKGATAEIPYEYLQWKPNYKYTYIFKISENSNGSTGQGVTGLYPITFDAIEVVTDEGEAEYITTVSEPSITTFGYDATDADNKHYLHGGSEYAAGKDIYATIWDGTAVATPTLGTNVNVYLATTTDATNFPITETSVAESLAEISVGAKKITVDNINDDASTNFTAKPAKVTTVPGEDGVNITIDALKLTGVKATTATTAIVIEYIKTPATYHTTAATYDSAPAFTLYSDPDGTTPVAWADNATNYYKRISVKNVGVYAYKVIRVQ